MLENEVDYRLAKWVIACMKHDGIICKTEMGDVLKGVAEYFTPPFLEVEAVSDEIGDGVMVGER